jgi:hypothetical protein
MKLKVSFAAIVSMLIALPALAEEPGTERIMPIPAAQPQLERDKEARLFIETLEKTGQLVDVDERQDTSQLPARVTHVRYPDGTVKRIRFTGSGYR